jgi:hypothetical protein
VIDAILAVSKVSAMARAYDFAKAREAILEAQREIRDAERRLETTFTTINLGAVKARQTLHEAETAVNELVTLLNAHPGSGINFPLIRKIRAAEIRVGRAREALRKIDPTSKD